MSRLPDARNARPDDPTPEDREARIAELRAKRRKRLRTIGLRSAAVSGVLIVATLVIGWWLLTTIAGRDLLLAQIKGRLPEGTVFEWSRAEGPASGPITLFDVRFSFKETHFTARRVMLDPALRPLISRRLRLDAMQVEGATLDLAPSEKPFELPKWPESLPQIAPPLAMQADTIVIDGLRITRAKEPLIDIRRVRGGLDVRHGRLQLEKVAVDSDRGDFRLHGIYIPAQRYRTDLTATAVLPLKGSAEPLRLGLVARGSITNMVVGIAGAAPAPVRATLWLHGPEEAVRWQLRARADGLDLGAITGTPDPDAPRMTANIAGDGTGGRARLTAEVVQGDMRIAVRPSNLQLEEQVLAFAPLDVDVLGGRVTVRGRGDFGDRKDARVNYSLVARGLGWGEGASRVQGDGEFGVSGTQAAWAVAGRSRLTRGTQRAQVDLLGTGANATLDLRRLQARMPTGTLDATGRVAWRPELAWDLRAQLAGFDPGYFVPGWNGALHGPVLTRGRQPTGEALQARVEIPRLGGRLRGRRVGGSGAFDIAGPRYAGHAALVVDRGRLLARGTMALQPTLRWDVDATLEDFDPSFVADGWPGAVDARLTTRGQRAAAPPGRTGALTADVDVARIGGTLRGRALAGSGSARIRGEDISGRVQLAAGGSRIDARGSIGKRLDIDARLSPLNLQDLLPDARGGLRGTLRISGPRNSPDIAADLTGRDVAVSSYRIGTLTARGRLPWRAGGTPGAISLRGTGLTLGLPFDTLNVDARGAMEALRLTADARGEFGAVALSGDARKAGTDWQARVATLRLAPARGAPWSLTSPTSLRFGGGRFALARTCLASSGGGSLCASGDWPRSGIAVDGRGVPLTLLMGYLPQQPGTERRWQPSGAIDLTARVRPVGGSWRGEATVTSAAGGFRLDPSQPVELVRWTGLSLRGTFDPQRLRFVLDSGLYGGGRVRADIATGWEAHSPLSGTVNADTRELTWIELFSPDIVEPQGQLTAQIRLSGTRAVPLLGGQARLTGFNTELPALGVELTDGTATLTARPDGSARIDGRVRSGEGWLNVDGDLAWRRTNAPIVLNLRGENVEVADTRQLRAVVDPNMQVRIQTGEPVRISGEVRVPSGLVQLERLERRVKASPDVVVLDPVDPVATSKPKTPIVLDFALIAGDDVRLQGFGLDGRVEGRMQVRTRPGGEVSATGRMDVSGRYVAYGQRLEITRGMLTWTGQAVGDPRLDIRAERRIGDVTAGIDVRGRASQPRANVWSSTGQTQSEALSYLALGRPIGTLGAEQGRQVSAAGAALSAGGSLLAAELGSRLGLDDAGVIESRTLGGSVFGIGKYISPRLYVGYGVSLLGTGHVLTLRYLLTRGFDLEFESGSEETRGSLNYRREK
ncbi:translocation/assembly module TamB domain-containing protein [Lysobacter humi (ex Lee et al. 2017)]